MHDDSLPTLRDLGERTGPVERPPADGELFLPWSRGPHVDQPDGGSSRDTLTGIALPGRSADPLAVEAWWGERPRRVRAARRTGEAHRR